LLTCQHFNVSTSQLTLKQQAPLVLQTVLC
jgi:hypothetical protein